MSNTATAAVLVPLATTIDPAPSSAIIVAIACSLGVPFAISTPPNAMAISAGLRSRDLALPGLILMFGGCALVALTGAQVLAAFGIREPCGHSGFQQSSRLHKRHSGRLHLLFMGRVRHWAPTGLTVEHP